MKRAAAVLLVSLMVFACNGNGDGNGSPTGPSQAQVLQGTFTLTSLTASEEGTTVTLTPPAVTGTLTLGPDNRYTITINWPAGGLINETSSGTYMVNGNVITATDDDGTVVTAMVSADQNTLTFTLVEEGVTGNLTYARV